MVSQRCKHAPRHLATASHLCSPWFAQPPASPWPPKRLPTLEPLLTFDLLFPLTSPHGKAPKAKKLLLPCNGVHAARWPTGLASIHPLTHDFEPRLVMAANSETRLPRARAFTDTLRRIGTTSSSNNRHNRCR